MSEKPAKVLKGYLMLAIGIVLFVAADFAHQKNGIDQNAATDHQYQQDPQHQQQAVPPVQQEIADVQNQQDGDQPDAQRDMPGDRSAAPGEFHDSRLARLGTDMNFRRTLPEIRCLSQGLAYAASRSETNRLFTEATLIALATPKTFSTLISSQLGSNSYQASPWRAEVGCAW